jgi:hypothetical protein
MKAASPGEDWRAAAACAEGNAWLFFASSTADAADAKIRKAATQARDALDTLRARHHADEQLKSIDEEAAALERRLALLREQKAALAGKPKPAAPRDYEPVDVRAWAATQGIELPPRGRVPQAVVDSWRKAGAPTRQQ